FRHRAGQALRLPQVMAAWVHRADQLLVPGSQEGIQGHDSGQTAVDGAGLEAPLALKSNKPVYVSEGNFPRWFVPDRCDEEAQVMAIAPPGAGTGVGAPPPVDERLVFDKNKTPSWAEKLWDWVSSFSSQEVPPIFVESERPLPLTPATPAS